MWNQFVVTWCFPSKVRGKHMHEAGTLCSATYTCHTLCPWPVMIAPLIWWKRKVRTKQTEQLVQVTQCEWNLHLPCFQSREFSACVELCQGHQVGGQCGPHRLSPVMCESLHGQFSASSKMLGAGSCSHLLACVYACVYACVQKQRGAAEELSSAETTVRWHLGSPSWLNR